MAVATDDDWDLDTDEIRSTASDELYETRPNRWRGPLSTWRHMTEEERLLHQNMEQVRDQDLAIHLFNAAMLRNPPQVGNAPSPRTRLVRRRAARQRKKSPLTCIGLPGRAA